MYPSLTVDCFAHWEQPTANKCVLLALLTLFLCVTLAALLASRADQKTWEFQNNVCCVSKIWHNLLPFAIVTNGVKAPLCPDRVALISLMQICDSPKETKTSTNWDKYKEINLDRWRRNVAEEKKRHLHICICGLAGQVFVHRLGWDAAGVPCICVELGWHFWSLGYQTQQQICPAMSKPEKWWPMLRRKQQHRRKQPPGRPSCHCKLFWKHFLC